MVEISQNIFFLWLSWHFFDFPRGILKAWKNFLLFNLNYFSTPLLLKTFFSHWRRYRWSYGRGFDLRRYFETFTFNIISRILGAVVRSIFIFLGIFLEILIIFVGIIVFLAWLTLPILLIAGLWFGFRVML